MDNSGSSARSLVEYYHFISIPTFESPFLGTRLGSVPIDMGRQL